jgi:RNA polymerase sigma-70 factor (ECF subfamily)
MTIDITEMYKQHANIIRQHVRALIPDKNSVEDIVQETFLRAWQHLESGKDISSKGSLIVIARNLIVANFYRRPSFMRVDITEDMDVFKVDENTTEHAIEINEKMAVVYKALKTVKPQYAKAFLLRRVYGYSLKEIGEILHISDAVASNYAALGFVAIQEYFDAEKIAKEAGSSHTPSRAIDSDPA